MVLDIVELRSYIEGCGIKQKYIAEKTGIPEPRLSMLLNGKRKCEVGEYANICSVLGVEFKQFIRPVSQVGVS